MQAVLLTALGVGGATVFGALAGYVLKGVSRAFEAVTMSAAAGVMLAAAAVGLFLPVFDCGGKWAALHLLGGAVCGGVCLNCFDRLLPKLEARLFADGGDAMHRHKVLLFVTAIAVHNLPEGLAAGVSFGTGSEQTALTVALAIALQNLPEGMVIVSPLLSAGFSPKKTLLIACGTGVTEILGTLLGYAAVSVSAAVLPFALSFAGGCMLYVIVDEMIPETHRSERSRPASYAFLLGFCVMLLLSDLLS